MYKLVKSILPRIKPWRWISIMSLHSANSSSGTHLINHDLVARLLRAHPNEGRRQLEPWNNVLYWWRSIRSRDTRWSYSLSVTYLSLFFLQAWNVERSTEELRPAAGWYHPVCCFPERSLQVGMRTAGRQNETDNPSGTYLRDNNDKSKQVSN